jgi:tetratricopeptide (TPR) repeat protein
VSEPLFDQYKAALRRGHLAAIAGRLDEALDAYGEAARLVPERALPFASRGTVLHRLDRWPEAAEAFDVALRLSPDDEATLRARAAAREERGMHSGAAADFERLALVLDVASRGRDAIEAARKAIALESTPARVALAERLADAATRAMERGARRDAARSAEGEAAAGAATAEVAEGGAWPAIDLPTPHPPPQEGPPPDPDALLNEAAELIEAGDAAAASERMLTAVLVHREAGRLDAALDICLQLLAIAPGDPHVHIAIANLQLDHGWTVLAKEKIELLLRLTALTGDTQAEADVHGLAAERLRDEAEPATAGR